ncbi:6420_t:CDS:2 [Funneliformis caledonium]|uniref:6420_t:CDS:1 n=1 Tax=Funneliformis caledonium TaxID=1117310 RepID=A0A9N9EZM0_9GLOM|nr:6420_t:CDS:2 [Funneliformis caledonium]
MSRNNTVKETSTREENQFQAYFSESYRSKIAVSSDIHPISQLFKIEHDPIEEGISSINIMHCKKKRKRIDHYRKPNEEIIDSNQSYNSSSDKEDSVNEDLVDEKIDEKYMLNEDVPVDLFTAPNFDDFDDGPKRFQLPDIALNALIRFFDLVLKDANSQRFKNFPSTAYMTRKLFDIKKKSKIFAVCPDCNKLYNINEIIKDNTNFTGFKSVKGHVWHPKMIYILPSLKTQLVTIYQRSGFEQNLKKWTNRNVEAGMMLDIYEGEV